MPYDTEADFMTPEERACEVAHILALGIIRLHAQEQQQKREKTEAAGRSFPRPAVRQAGPKGAVQHARQKGVDFQQTQSVHGNTDNILKE